MSAAADNEEEEANDPFDAFGSDDDDDDEGSDDDMKEDNIESNDDDNTTKTAADRVASSLAKTFFWNKRNIKVGGIKRRVAIILINDCCSNNDRDFINAQRQEGDAYWESTLQARGFTVTFTVVGGTGNNHITSTDSNARTKILSTSLPVDRQEPFDAMVLLWSPVTSSSSVFNNNEIYVKLVSRMQRAIVPGGVLVVPSYSSSSLGAEKRNVEGRSTNDTTSALWDDSLWNIQEAELIYEYPRLNETTNDNSTSCCYSLWAVTKRPCPIQSSLPTCTWLPPHYNVQAEQERVDQATVCLSADEIRSSKLSETSLQQAVQAVQDFGYCILPRLLANRRRDLPMIKAWGQAARDDLHEAAGILKDRDGVDLYHPHESRQEPASYREMSMREDFRMDLRHGPRLAQLRANRRSSSSDETSTAIDNDNDRDDDNDGNLPWTVKAKTPLPGAIPTQDDDDGGDKSNNKFHACYFLRGHVDILEIVRRVMNPTKDTELSAGNFGRWNFSGSGPDGSFQDLRVSPVGAILSLPGSADQAIHADTPHLMEHVSCLPAHYINVFTPGCAAAPASVGQTALVHASHTLEFCARYMNDDNGKQTASIDSRNGEKSSSSSWKDFLVRPCLDLGDVLIFDCRILHFGLANSSDSGIERPLLYTNMTQHWFHDPKNWQNQRPIFGGGDEAQQSCAR